MEVDDNVTTVTIFCILQQSLKTHRQLTTFEFCWMTVERICVWNNEELKEFSAGMTNHCLHNSYYWRMRHSTEAAEKSGSTHMSYFRHYQLQLSHSWHHLTWMHADCAPANWRQNTDICRIFVKWSLFQWVLMFRAMIRKGRLLLWLGTLRRWCKIKVPLKIE